MNEFARSLSNAMTPLYVEKLRLSQAPFTERYTESLYYENETRKDILKKITHLTEYTNLVLFIQGAEGLGKTSLIRHRLNLAKTSWRICYFNSKDYVNPDAFIEKLFKDFQLKYTSNTQKDQPTSLHEQIEGLYQTGLTPVVVIDDIHQLSERLIPTLQSLISFNKENRPLVRLIVAGEDIPDSLLKILPLEKGQPAIKYLPLPPLSEKETTAYIKYKLTQSGYNQNEPFNKTILKKIYLDSKGFPKFINQLADYMMNQHMHSGGDKKPAIQFSGEDLKKIKIAAAILATIVVITLLVTTIMNSSDDSSETEIAENSNVNDVSPVVDSPASIVNTATFTDAEMDEVEIAPTKQAETIATKPTDQATVSKTEKEVIVEKESLKIISTSEKVESKSKPDSTLVVSEKITPKNKPEEKKKETKPEKRLSPELEWLNAQDPAHYTLQLIGSSSEKSAINFIKKHGIEKDAKYFHTIRKEKDWYFIVYKSYPSGRSAREATQNLPSSLKKTKPWIRTFKDIKKDLE